VSLAPRFCGDFEKGIDFKGDIQQFEREYRVHQAIAMAYGAYKLSIHSGSDKFQVYEAIGRLGLGSVHVKTAGTSYLEALRAIAIADPDLLREIYAFSLERFDVDRKTYHISADPAQLAPLDKPTDSDLSELLNQDHARQIFHVTYGSVLTSAFKNRIHAALSASETIYEAGLQAHFHKHIQPFLQQP